MRNHNVYRRILLLCMVALTFFRAGAQEPNITVNGVVTDDKGEAIIQASIAVEGTKNGTVTDAFGKFTLDVPGDAYLIISHLGYTNVRIAAKADLRIAMKSASTTLNDVVVIGYGTVPRQELTGSVAKISEKDFDQGTITTPEQLIQGKVAGVSITGNGGSPGSGSTVRIRGIASINGNQDPLYVIDGLPINQETDIYGTSNPLSTINPNDIESFTILKDGAATAIYGSRASAGVIIITTKKGTKGKPQFSFTTNNSVATIAKRQDVLTADQFRNYVNNSPLGDSLFGTVPFKSLLGKANTDWQKEIYQKAFTTDDNFSVSGSLKNLPYRLSVGYLDQNGMLKTDNLKRYSGSISLTPSLLKDHLKININLKGSEEDVRFANGAAISSAIYFDPTQPVYTAGSPYGGYTEWASGNTLNKLAPRNPLALLEMYNNTAKVYRSFGNAQFDYKFPFLTDLHANLNLGYDVSSSKGGTYVPANAAQNFLDSGQRNPYSNNTVNTVSEFYLSYNKALPSIKSTINATAGYGFYSFTDNKDYYQSYRANGDTIPGTKPVYYFDKFQNALLSYYARVIYTFDTRYILAASFRKDQSARFPSEGQNGNLPSIAFTWRANKEKFLANAKDLSTLNLRLSYGATGNQSNVGNYLYERYYTQGGNSSQVQLGNQYYNMGTPQAFNVNIQWEQTKSSNVGIDYGFFNNRLSGSIEAYYKNTTGLLNLENLAAGTNFAPYIEGNIGAMYNKGIEFTINGTPIQTKHITWDVSFNITYNKTQVTKLTANDDSTFVGNINTNGVQINTVGYAPNSFYVYHQEYDKNGKPIEGVYKDMNGDGIINQKDLYRDHSPFPNLIYGFSTQFNYDKWSLTTVLRANTGNYMYNSVAAGAAQANTFNSLGYLANSVSQLTETNFHYNQPLSDYFVQNAAFIKMDNIAIGYNFGKVIRKKVGIRVNVYCQNVFTITKYKGIDPEIYGGYDAGLYPRPRIYGLGANIQF